MSADPSRQRATAPPWPRRTAAFVLRVLRGFQEHQGLLLAGAVAYYTLLSIVPLSAIILVALSHFVNEDQLIQTIARNLELLIPGYADSIANQVRTFFARRHLVGVVGFVIMLFFSSMAFSVLESTMAVIFSHRKQSLRRPFFISAIIPYVYILLIGLGFFLVTIISGALDALDRRHISYYNDDDGGLYYAYYDGAGWTFTLVDGEPSSGGDDSLALDAAGEVWFAETAGNKIGRLNPATGAIREYGGLTAGSEPWGVAVDGRDEWRVWFTERAGNRIGSLNPASGTVAEYALGSPNSLPSGLSASSVWLGGIEHWYLWFAEPGSNLLGRMRLADYSLADFDERHLRIIVASLAEAGTTQHVPTIVSVPQERLVRNIRAIAGLTREHAVHAALRRSYPPG